MFGKETLALCRLPLGASVTESWQMEEGRPRVSKLHGKPVGEPIMCLVLPPYLPAGCLPPVARAGVEQLTHQCVQGFLQKD